MKEICKVAGINGKKTNQTAHKTMATRLIQDNIPPQQEAELTGHKNLKSLDYASASTTTSTTLHLSLLLPMLHLNGSKFALLTAVTVKETEHPYP